MREREKAEYKGTELVPTEQLAELSLLTDNQWIFDVAVERLDRIREEIEGPYWIRSAVGTFRGASVVVTRYGASLLPVLLEELLRKGARVLVKIGLGVYLVQGRPQLVLCVGAARFDRSLDAYYSPEAPAIASFKLAIEVAESLEALGVDYEEEVVLSVGAPIRNLEEICRTSASTVIRRLGITTIDVDTAALYLTVRAKKAKAVSLVIPAFSIGEVSAIGLWTNARPDEKDERYVESVVEGALEGLRRFKERALVGVRLKRLSTPRENNIEEENER